MKPEKFSNKSKIKHLGNLFILKKHIICMDEEKQEMQEIIANLKKKMSEIDELTKDLADKKEIPKNTPKKTKRLLEEIKVPSLDLLK
jgi:hypothetical protein